MQTNTVLKPFADLGSIGTGEFEPFERGPDSPLLFTSANIDTGEILRALGCFELGEMNDVNRSAALGDKAFHRGGQRQFGKGELQRDRTVLAGNRYGRAAVQSRQLLLEKGRVAQCGRH